MRRRRFLLDSGRVVGTAMTGLSGRARLLAALSNRRIRWQRSGGDPSVDEQLFASASCDGKPLIAARSPGLLDATCRLRGVSAGVAIKLSSARPSDKQGPIAGRLLHQLSGSGSRHGEDLLQATLVVRNESDLQQEVEIEFATSAQPNASATPSQLLYLPLNGAGLQRDQRFASLGVEEFLQDCKQTLGREGFECHYLEPMASHAAQRSTKALLLAPVVDMGDSHVPWRVAIFTRSDEAMTFRSQVDANGARSWRISRSMSLAPRQTIRESCWLLIHEGDARAAWKAFHRCAHHETHALIDWAERFKVHYYDFLSSASGKEGRRGDGYDAAVPQFAKFHVGLATQHGYYPYLGDFVHPDRKTWPAMKGDARGPVSMSIAKMADRIRATQTAGAKAGVYLHLALLDDASPLYPRFAAGRRCDADGSPMRFPWTGPDVKGACWWMSIASREWREHLLEQARWIMELLDPDAICIDETFAGLGYDYAAGRSGPLSPHAIEFFQDMHALVRSFGEEKALFTSDCSMSGFAMWADGDVGDHAYPGSLGNPLYRQEPVRYLAVLNDKPWRPCAWHFSQMWELQMELARQTGAGVGVSNGWIEYTGLHELPDDLRRMMIRDIESIL